MAATTHSILVVDDDVDTCHNLADILEDAGYRVDVAYDGPSAIRLIEQDGYDVALLDLKMPGMDGLTLYREIHKRAAATVAMIVTAYASGETTRQALQAGTWQVLSKPVNVAKLMTLVSEATAQPLILVVDDDREFCQSLWELLKQQGYRSSVAHSEAEAADHLKQREFQVVLVDMKLQEGNGGNVFRLVRDVSPQARTVLITGYRSELQEVVDATIAEGADAVCYKPFDVPELLGTIRRLVEQGRNGAGEATD